MEPPFKFTELELTEAEIAQLCVIPVLEPAEDLQSALARVAYEPVSVEEAGAVTTWPVPGARELPAARAYRPREAGVVLGVFAACLLAFDSEGLMTWVQRMDVGPVQSAWLASLGPVNAGFERAGLTAPRRWIIGVGEKLSQAIGAGEDPLLAEGWMTPELIALPPPPPLAMRPIVPERVEAAVAPTQSEAGPQPVAVLLVGDSMIAGSLGGHLTRALAKDVRLRAVQAFQTATGLSRPDVFDWMKVLPPLLERERPRLIVCSLGANDATNIRDEHDRQLDFGEPGWRAAYAARVLAMMQTLTATGARVLWLGLPPMREARFSSHTATLNGIVAQVAKKVPGVEFLELRMLVSDNASGEYATFVHGADGKLVRYRLDDGIHYSPAGARAITRWVVDWIYERYRKLPAPD